MLGGVVVFHQHNGEFQFGKSAVAGDAGDPFQAFGPALARRSLAVLAPDSIAFEDRRGAVKGTDPDYYDWLQHYNAMSCRGHALDQQRFDAIVNWIVDRVSGLAEGAPNSSLKRTDQSLRD